MGVDTKAIIRKGVTLEAIEQALYSKYEKVEVSVNKMPSDFAQIFFKDGECNRMMSISFSNSCERDNGIAGVWLSLSCWGNSVDIMKYLCETFGGYLDENDCDSEDFYPINIELYEKGMETTEMDKLRMELAALIGYTKVNQTIEIFEKYKTLA